jgi:alkylhydroperoxidase family enzyme
MAPANMPEDLRKLHAASTEVVGGGRADRGVRRPPGSLPVVSAELYRTLFENGDGTMVADMRWKELIRLKMSLSHGCFVCNSFNVPSARAADSPGPDRLDPRSTPEEFSPAELAVLELGDQISMQNLDGALTPDLHERLARHFTAAEILELGVIAAMLTGWTKLMFTFDLVTREDNCPVRVAAPR